MNALEEIETTTAAKAIELYQEIADKTKELERVKEELRILANEKTITISVEGKGKVIVTEPRAESQKTVLVFNEEKLVSAPEIKAKLLEKGILIEETKITPAAKASVRITPNI